MRTLALAALLLVAATACGPVQKQAAVTKVASAVRRSAVRTGYLSLASRPVGASGLGPTSQTLPPQLQALAGAGTAAAPVGLDLILDTANHEAALLQKGQTLVLWDANTVYVRVRDIQQVGARPWASLDLTQIGAVAEAGAQQLQQPRSLGDLAVLNPQVLEQQGLGLLTGSVHNRGATSLAAPNGSQESVVEYAGNVSFDKVARQLHKDPDTNRPVQELLRVFAAHDDINTASVWLDPQGNLDGLSVAFNGRPQRNVKFAVTYSLTLNPPGTPVATAALTPPAAAQVVQLSNLDQLRAELDNWAKPKPSLP